MLSKMSFYEWSGKPTLILMEEKWCIQFINKIDTKNSYLMQILTLSLYEFHPRLQLLCSYMILDRKMIVYDFSIQNQIETNNCYAIMKINDSKRNMEEPNIILHYWLNHTAHLWFEFLLGCFSFNTCSPFFNFRLAKVTGQGL